MRRRYFNKTLITSVAGFSLPQNLVSKSSNSKKLGIALGGLGSYSSKALGPALFETKKCELKAVVTGTKEKEKIWAEKYNLSYKQIYNYENFESISFDHLIVKVEINQIEITLNRANKKNGGVYYFEGSHKLGLLNHKPSFAPGSSQTIKSLRKLKKCKINIPKLPVFTTEEGIKQIRNNLDKIVEWRNIFDLIPKFYLDKKMKKVYTVAIVGAGSISQAHMNGYNLNKDRVDVIGVVDPYKIAQDEFKNEYSVKKSFNNIDDLFNDCIPDIVSICTWHSLHHTQTIDIAKRGVKAIICEKPMAIGSGPAQEMLDACIKNNVKLIISHQRRFTPGWEKAKELVDSGIIGDIKFVELKALEGLLNWATHNIDGSRYIIGDPETEWVFGAVERTTNKYERNTVIEDACMGLIEYKDGVQTFIQSDLNQYDYTSKWKTNHPIVIRGEKGVLDITEYEIKMLGKDKGWETIPADVPKENIDPIGGETNGKLVKELIELLDEKIDSHRCSGENAKKTLDIMMSIYQSARINERVHFPVTEKEYPLELMANENKFNLKVK